MQERLAVEGITPEESDVMTKIQDILYATIEGFEVCCFFDRLCKLTINAVSGSPGRRFHRGAAC